MLSKLLDKLAVAYHELGFSVVVVVGAVLLAVSYNSLLLLNHVATLTGFKLYWCRLDFSSEQAFEGITCGLFRPVKLQLTLQWWVSEEGGPGVRAPNVKRMVASLTQPPTHPGTTVCSQC